MAILAAVWAGASFRTRVRLKLHRGAPLVTCFVMVTLCIAGGIAAEVTEGFGQIKEATRIAILGALGVIALVTVGWMLWTTQRHARFSEATARKFDETIEDAITRGRPEELREIARELEGSGRVIGAAAMHYGRPEASKGSQRAGWHAIRIMNWLADERMMEAICEEGGLVLAAIVDEISRARREPEWRRPCTEGIELPVEEVERQMLEEATRQAVRPTSHLLNGASAHGGPRRNVYHPTQKRWQETIIDDLWGNDEVWRRMRWWTSLSLPLGRSKEVDPAKLFVLAKAVLDTYLAGTWPSRGDEGPTVFAVRDWLAMTVFTAMEQEAKGDPSTVPLGIEGFIRDLLEMIQERQELEAGREKGPGKGGMARVLAQRKEDVEAVANAVSNFLAFPANKATNEHLQWLAVNSRWLSSSPRIAKHEEGFVDAVGRQVDRTLWERFKRAAMSGRWKSDAALLGRYLRAEGMQRMYTGRAGGITTTRSHKALERATRYVCRRHLGRTLQRNPHAAIALCNDEMDIEERDGKLFLRYRPLLRRHETYRLEIGEKREQPGGE